MTQPSALDPLLLRLDRLAQLLEHSHPAGNQPAAVPPLPPGQAFVWQVGGHVRTVQRPAHIDPALLVGVERQMELFYTNVERFLHGVPAHDVLLWGDRGTGKSSLVRSLLTRFAGSRLALLAIGDDNLALLPALLDTLSSDPRRWILFFDDLAFAGPGNGYREFKLLLEGGVEECPDNTLAVATSNRRHLLPESFAADDDLHPEESVAETTSLADRFGLSLGFYPFDQGQFFEAVQRHLHALGCQPLPTRWQAQARQWAMARGIRSGRSALQAARAIAGAAQTG